jgi:hypothetical protein
MTDAEFQRFVLLKRLVSADFLRTHCDGTIYIEIVIFFGLRCALGLAASACPSCRFFLARAYVLHPRASEVETAALSRNAPPALVL